MKYLIYIAVKIWKVFFATIVLLDIMVYVGSDVGQGHAYEGHNAARVVPSCLYKYPSTRRLLYVKDGRVFICEI